MDRIQKVFFNLIVILVFFDIMVVFFLSFNSQKYFVKDSYCVTSSIFLKNNCEIDREYKSFDDMYLFQSQNIQDYFLKHMYVIFDYCIIFYKFLFSFPLSLDEIKKKICDSKNVLIGQLMNQSCDLLNRDLIQYNTVVIELRKGIDQVSWVIQLGAFKNFQKVLELVSKLKTHNYPVYISPENPKSEDLVRIFIGPYFSNENLKYVLDDLYSLSSLVGKIYVLPYD